MLQFVRDRLANLVTGLGTAKDKSTGAAFLTILIGRDQLEAMYRSDWLSRKIVDVIPFDMTRAWRDWQAGEKQIEALEGEEKRLCVRDKVALGMQRGRLYGGGAIYIGTSDSDPSQPLNVEGIKKGGVTYLHVLSQHEVTTGEVDRDPLSPLFGEPTYYELQGGNRTTAARIHPSRVIRFLGAPLPDLSTAGSAWSDPVLQIIHDAVLNAASAPQHVAALLPELKTDIISVPGLSSHLATKEGTERVQSRFASANLIRSMHSVLLLEGGAEGASELWQQRQINFANFPELLRMFLQIAAGAADIPVTRLLGQAPSGLNATGDNDTRNYYDMLAARQAVELGPRLDRLDECLIRSALGSRPPEVHYRFAPLWQMTEAEKADIATKKAAATKVYLDAGLVPDAVLEVAVKNQLIEDGTYPGIEAAYDEFDAGKLESFRKGEEEDEDELAIAAQPGGNVVALRSRMAAKDAEPRTLYISRKVKNGSAIIAWAREQGFTKTLAAEDLHVTIAFSRRPVDWMNVGESWSPELKVGPGGPRLMERFGDATVLLFTASELRWRHEEIERAGASWDHDEYQPQITISYEAGDVDLSKVQPYQGRIVLGPELFAEVDEDWKAKVTGGDREGDGPF